MRIGNKISAGSLLALCGVCCFSGALNAEPVKAAKNENPSLDKVNLQKQAPEMTTTNVAGRRAKSGGVGPQGANDLCADAQAVTLGSVTFGSTLAATVDSVPTCGTTVSAPGVWYSIVGDGTTFTADLCNGFTTYDSKISVFCGGCATPVCVAGNDDFCGLQSSVSWCTTAGETYLILVHGFSSSTGDFELSVNSDGLTCGGAVPCTPCIFECPIGATPEGEPDCFDLYVDATNGGCNSTPEIFGSASVGGGDICGTAGTFLGLYDNGTPSNPNDDFITNFRDTDWYQFTLTAPTEVTLTGSAGFDVLFGFVDMNGGCAGAGGFTASVTGTGCQTVTVTKKMQPGTYVAFVGTQGFTGVACGSEYSFNLTGVPFFPPTNDTCDAAVPVAINSTTPGSTSGGGVDAGLPTCGTAITAPGVWYTVVGDGTSLTADTCTFTNYDTKISVFCGDCALGEFYCVGGNDDSCGLNSSLTWCSEAGKLYYILVHGFSSAEGDFDLNLFSDGIACAEPPLCAPCVVDPAPGATPEGEPDCFDLYVDATNGGCNSVPEVYGAIACGETVTGTSGHYLGLYDNGTPSNPNDDFITNFRDTDWDLFTLDAPKEVTITTRAEFDVLAGVVDLNLGCGSAAFAFSNTGLSCTTVTASGILAPGTYVVFVATSDFAGRPCGLNYNVTMDCTDPVLPENDFCEDAISVAIGSTTPGTTSGATIDLDAPFCGSGGVTSPGVWYKVVGNGNTLDASLCNPNRTFDTKLNVYCGDCGNFICVDGVDDSCDGLGSNITWCSEAGKEYLILVHSFGGQTGTFDLVVTDFGPGCTPSVTCPSSFCAADLTGSSDPNDPSYGVPDGLVDASDFFYYLDQFVNGNLAIADLTGSSDPNDPSYGVPDGDADADDFFVYLDRFVACQP
ncbi:MAG: hypothetical protein IT439_12610 [Phycisphaerales bacterium]|nr:hypothetical protein [Phycisphaerales bacterium]